MGYSNYSIHITTFPRDLYRAAKKARADINSTLSDLRELEDEPKLLQKAITKEIIWAFGCLMSTVSHWGGTGNENADDLATAIEKAPSTMKGYMESICRSLGYILYIRQIYPDFDNFAQADIEEEANGWKHEVPEMILKNIGDYLKSIKTNPIYPLFEQIMFKYFCPPEQEQDLRTFFEKLPTISDEELDWYIEFYEWTQPRPETNPAPAFNLS